MNVVSEDNPDWYAAEMNGTTGMVPKNYFEVYYTDYNEKPTDSYSYYDDQADYRSSIYPDFDVVPVKKPGPVTIVKVIYDYQVSRNN